MTEYQEMLRRVLREEVRRELAFHLVERFEYPDFFGTTEGVEVNTLIPYKGKLYAWLYGRPRGECWEFDPQTEEFKVAYRRESIGDSWAGIAWKGNLYFGGWDKALEDAGLPPGTVIRFDGATWSRITDFEKPVSSFCPFDDYLYLSLANGKIYRSSDGLTWTLVYTPAESISWMSLVVLGANIYALARGGTIGVPLSWVYRSADGVTWTKIADLKGIGFRGTSHRAVFNDKIYVGSYDGAVYRSEDGVVWTKDAMLVPRKRPHGMGTKIERTSDVAVKSIGGLLWAFVGTPLAAGYGSLWVYDGEEWLEVLRHHGGISAVEVFGGELFVGTAWHNEQTIAEILRYSPEELIGNAKRSRLLENMIDREVDKGYRPAETYFLLSTGTFALDFPKLMPNDGNDILSIQRLEAVPLATDGWVNVAVRYAETAEFPMQMIAEMVGYPTYVTSGGFDRAPYMERPVPIRIERLGEMEFVAIANCQVRCFLRMAHKTLRNRASADLGATLPVKPATNPLNAIRNLLSSFSTDTTTAGVEDEALRLDLGDVYHIFKLCVRLSYWIDVAQAGSFVKVYISEDAVTWDEIYNSGDLPTTETEAYVTAANKYFRYLRVTANSADPARTATVRIYPIFAWGNGTLKA